MVAPKPGNKAPAFGGKAGSAPKPGSPTLPGAGGGSALSSFFADVDFDSVESFAQLAVGQHLGQVRSVVPGYSSGGNEQLEITFGVIGGPNDGRSTKYWIVKTPKTIWKIKQFMASLGYSDEEMKSATYENMKGRYTVLQVALDDFRNDGSTRVVNTFPYDPDAEEVTEEDV
jgi:hypothetical protein